MTRFNWQIRSQDLFGRIGQARANLKGLHDEVVPVIPVDRFYSDEEGSMYGTRMTVPQIFIPPATPALAAVVFGSAINDWELRQLQAYWFTGTGGIKSQILHTYIVGTAYNPVEFAQGPLLQSGLATSPYEPTDLNGSVFSFIGYQESPPPIGAGPANFPRGYTVLDNDFEGSHAVASAYEGHPLVWTGGLFRFDPPIRVLRNNAFAVQSLGFDSGHAFQSSPGFSVSLLYNERPRVNINPRDRASSAP